MCVCLMFSFLHSACYLAFCCSLVVVAVAVVVVVVAYRMHLKFNFSCVLDVDVGM